MQKYEFLISFDQKPTLLRIRTSPSPFLYVALDFLKESRRDTYPSKLARAKWDLYLLVIPEPKSHFDPAKAGEKSSEACICLMHAATPRSLWFDRLTIEMTW